MQIPFLTKEDTFSPSEVETTLIVLKGFLNLGFSPLEAIKTLADNALSEKEKNIYSEIEYETHELNRPLQNVLLTKQMISPLEHTIMSKSLDMRSAIDTILDMRKNSNKFEKKIIGIFLFPLILLSTAFGAIVFGGGEVVGFIDFLTHMAEISTGTPVKADIPWFLTETTLTNFIFWFLIIFSISLFFLYKNIYKTNTKLIYKLAPLKVYDDAPIIFQMMYNLKKTGMPAGELMEEMIKNVYPAPLRDMFIDINKKIEQNRPFYTVFKQYNFPDHVVSILEIGEKTYTLWENLPELIQFTKDTGEQKIKNFEKIWKPVFLFGSQIFLLYVIIITFLTVTITATSLM